MSLCILIYSNLFYLQHSQLVYPFEAIISGSIPVRGQIKEAARVYMVVKPQRARV